MRSGWGGRSRTLTYGTRNRCPTIRRHPNNYAIENTQYSLGASSYISVTITIRQDYFWKKFNISLHLLCSFAATCGTFVEIAQSKLSSLRIVSAVYSKALFADALIGSFESISILRNLFSLKQENAVLDGAR